MAARKSSPRSRSTMTTPGTKPKTITPAQQAASAAKLVAAKLKGAPGPARATLSPPVKAPAGFDPASHYNSPEHIAAAALEGATMVENAPKPVKPKP